MAKKNKSTPFPSPINTKSGYNVFLFNLEGKDEEFLITNIRKLQTNLKGAGTILFSNQITYNSEYLNSLNKPIDFALADFISNPCIFINANAIDSQDLLQWDIIKRYTSLQPGQLSLAIENWKIVNLNVL